MQANKGYEEILGKLDAFIRKYYKNQLLCGTIYSFSLLLTFYLVLTVSESFIWFNATVRSVFFWSYLLTALWILYKWILIPLLNLNRIGKILTYNDAAKIIGQHFTDINDKLLNTLQLFESLENNNQNKDLLLASIEQKSKQLRPVPFTSAVDLSKNKKYIKYALPSLIILIGILIVAPGLIADSTKRLFYHNTQFTKPAPFKFSIANNKLQTTQFEDYTLEVKVNGKEIPQEVYIEYNGNTFKLDKKDKLNFNYTFRNLQKNTPFQLMADGFYSDEYEVEIIPNPLIVQFYVDLNYPAYLQKKNESIKNTGDLYIPAGTQVKWNFGTQNTSQLDIRFGDTTYHVNQNDDNQFVFQKRLMNGLQYSVRSVNSFITSKDSMVYTINVVPDQYPTIQTEEQKDTTSYQKLFFRGITRDDYGISKINFQYRFIKRDGQAVNEKVNAVAINCNHTLQEQFFYYWDISTVGVKPGDELEYYFESWDNDGVSGPKSVKSQATIFKAPSLGELAQDAEQKNKALKNEMEASIRKAKELQKSLDAIQKQLLNKKNLDFEDKKKINDVLKQQKELEKKIQELKEKYEQNNQLQNEMKSPDPELAEKEKQLEKLFDELMTPEMKKMMEELEKLMAEFDKEKIQEKMNEMKFDTKDLEKQLERTLELYKKMELEEKMKETANQLEELSKEENKLADQAEKKDAKAEEIKKEQQELNKKFDDIQKSLDDIEKKNEELEYSQDMKNFDQEQNAIDQDMKNSENQLNQSQSSKASKSQKSAAKKMQDLADKIQQQQQQQQQEQEQEDENALRALLENLLRFSFDQEKLMQDLRSVDINDPKFLKMSQQQRKLKDDAKVLEDSLLALSKRVAKISSTVNEEITNINANTEKAIFNLQDRQVQQARSNQQYVMTSVNNLALILSESLDQMQQQMMQQMPSNSSCKKPGQGQPKPGPNAGDIKKMQEKLSQQLKEMKEQMQKGGKDGKGGQGGQKGMSEQLAKMAAQQEALRNMIQQLDKEQNKDGQGKLGDLQKIAKQMEETEKDIVNKRITDLTLNRQQDILTRLLESEKAEKEREQDQKRESFEGNDMSRTSPQFEEYKKAKMKETELLKTIPPSFNNFYKNLVNSYFQSIGN